MGSKVAKGFLKAAALASGAAAIILVLGFAAVLL